MPAFFPDVGVVASLPVTAWAPAPASLALTADADLIVTLALAPGRTCHHRFALSCLRPPAATDPPGSIVLAEHGERFVLPVDGGAPDIAAFADALAVALERGAWAKGGARGLM